MALIIRAGKSPPQRGTWEQGQEPNTSPATLNNNCWNHSGFITETGLPTTLWKRENQWECCLWNLIFSFGQDFHDSLISSAPWKRWPQPLRRYHQASEDQAAGISHSAFPWLFPICPPLFAWLFSLGKEPRQIYVYFLIYIPDNKSEVDISYYVIYKFSIFIKL